MKDHNVTRLVRLGRLCGLLALGSIPLLVHAAGDLQLKRSTLYGSAGTSSGGSYSVRSTVAQPDAGAASGGEFEIDGGFAEGDPFACDAPVGAADCAATDSLCGFVLVSWTDASDDETGFKILRDDSLVAVAGADAVQWPDTTAAPGEIHSYAVVATSGCGDGNPSNSDDGHHPALPVAPDSVRVLGFQDLGDSLQVDLAWTDRSADEIFQVVYLQLDSLLSSVDTLDADLEQAQVRIEDSDAEEYCLLLSAFNCGMEAVSDTACFSPGTSSAPGPPHAPGAESLPARFALKRASPNPFNPRVRIFFDAPAPAHTEIAVFEVSGRRVATLLDRRVDAGRHSVEWNGADGSGRPLASGVYFARMTAPGYRKVLRLILLK